MVRVEMRRCDADFDGGEAVPAATGDAALAVPSRVAEAGWLGLPKMAILVGATCPCTPEELAAYWYRVWRWP